MLAYCSGCAAIPEVRHQPQLHNPFPQLHRVAILPFFNLSTDPTINQDDVALAYYAELQQIPGFEVVPPGVVRQFIEAKRIEINVATNFQQLARDMGVDVLIRGAVTDYSPYYPPRIGLSVDWFAANPSFHPIPVGYGLPWGTPDEEYIPDSLVLEAEFALAREQLKTQTPDLPAETESDHAIRQTANQPAEPLPVPPPSQPAPFPEVNSPDLPPDWPDPRGFIPPPPSPIRPPQNPQPNPIISHTRIYRGNDERVTERLEQYYFFRDDARYGGWEGYLTRSEDFIRFCCYLHIAETLSARGGAGKTRVAWRWPIGRYDVGTGRR